MSVYYVENTAIGCRDYMTYTALWDRLDRFIGSYDVK